MTVANHNPVNVLLVDDQPGKLLSYEVMLAELGENLIPVSSAKDALAFLLKSEVAVILVDVCMPELDGFELAKMIREHPRFQKTPMIFISGVHLSQTDFLRGYEAGAVDYLSVPVVPELLRAKVRVFAELFRKTRDLHQLNQGLERRVAERTAALEASASKLRQSEQGKSLALAAGNMGSWHVDIESGGCVWDEGQSQILGLDHENFSPSAEKVRQLIHPGDFEAVRRKLGEFSPDATTCEMELRIVRPTGEVRWCTIAAAATLNDAGGVVRVSGVTTDITDRKEAEARQALLAREVDHRAKNALAVVQAIIRLARRDDVHAYIEAVEGRIGALAQTHELLSQSRWEGADVLRLVTDELAPYRNDNAQRITAIGPPLFVSPENAQAIAMTIHELATNAAKYGALSQEAGRVDISWTLFENRLTVTWRETGGPPVSAPKTKGFGTKIISSMASKDDGCAEFDWRPEGLVCVFALHCEVRALAPHLSNAALTALAVPRNAPPSQTEPSSSHGGRILLVEDEIIVGIFTQEVLQGMGIETTEPIGRLSEAIDMTRREKFAGAILDMNLNGEMVYPLADVLLSQDIPFFFVTGYAPSGIEGRFSKIPLLQKPVTSDMLEEVTRVWLLRESAIPPAAKARRPASAEFKA